MINEKLKRIEDKLNLFTGWDFSEITSDGSMFTEPTTWDYKKIIGEAIHKSSAMLDLGTGGGELLMELSDLPEFTAATEGFLPNLKIAQSNLKQRGVIVKHITEDVIPYKDNTFDLVINRHESYKPEEVFRVLKKDGVFITQQVGGLNDRELNTALGAEESEYTYWNLDYACRELGKYFNIAEKKEEFVRTIFKKIDAVCFYLNAIPWQIPDFSIEKYADSLLKIDERINKEKKYSVTCHRFLICAVKKEE